MQGNAPWTTAQYGMFDVFQDSVLASRFLIGYVVFSTDNKCIFEAEGNAANVARKISDARVRPCVVSSAATPCLRVC